MIYFVVKHTGVGTAEIGLVESDSKENLVATLNEQANPDDMMGTAFTFQVAAVGEFIQLKTGR